MHNFTAVPVNPFLKGRTLWLTHYPNMRGIRAEQCCHNLRRAIERLGSESCVNVLRLMTSWAAVQWL